ncbi:hypothetical protein ANN_25063 [Periplaneta americana]|uniref:Uncharacterized protein n=1 Tax=Periplaneta americana TaxID=6978 RepID=A0ABQ8S0X9_PERAM|nr:hypothetical protein ANN_25063 [Periplaneta americana]
MAGLCEGGNEPPGSLKAIFHLESGFCVERITLVGRKEFGKMPNILSGQLLSSNPESEKRKKENISKEEKGNTLQFVFFSVFHGFHNAGLAVSHPPLAALSTDHLAALTSQPEKMRCGVSSRALLHRNGTIPLMN